MKILERFELKLYRIDDSEVYVGEVPIRDIVQLVQDNPDEMKNVLTSGLGYIACFLLFPILTMLYGLYQLGTNNKIGELETKVFAVILDDLNKRYDMVFEDCSDDKCYKVRVDLSKYSGKSDDLLKRLKNLCK